MDKLTTDDDKIKKELTPEQREILSQDILDRYDNIEYWNLDLLEIK